MGASIARSRTVPVLLPLVGVVALAAVCVWGRRVSPAPGPEPSTPPSVRVTPVYSGPLEGLEDSALAAVDARERPAVREAIAKARERLLARRHDGTAK